MEIKNKIVAMFKKRIAEGKSVSAASTFSFTDFSEMTFDEFKEICTELKSYGWINKRYMRSFTLSDDVIEDIMADL